MADLLTPSSVTMTTINASAESPKSNEGAKKVPKPKPEKPDERKYQESLAKAQEEHAIAQQKVVCTQRALLDVLRFRRTLE